MTVQWVTVFEPLLRIRVLFFAWISALTPPIQVYHSFSCKKCISPCCNSVCRTENVVGYMPQRWQFKGSPNNLPPGGGTSACFMARKAQGDHFQNTMKKNWRMIPMLRNAVITKKCWFCENYFPMYKGEDCGGHSLFGYIRERTSTMKNKNEDHLTNAWFKNLDRN